MGFEEVRVTKDLKKFGNTLASMFNRGEFLKGSVVQDVQVSEPMFVEEHVWQCQ